MAVRPHTLDVARQCAQELSCYLHGEPVVGEAGFELFRRAVVERDDDAWAALSAQFAPFVRRWLDLRAEDAAASEGVAATFERFWQAVTPEKFSSFTSLAVVLQYLKMCARSARLDRVRAARFQARQEPLDEAVQHLPAGDNPLEQVREAQDTAALWQAVRRCLADTREQVVIYLCYVQGLTPREICARHSALFPTVTGVYRIKRSALDRLRRAPALRALA